MTYSNPKSYEEQRYWDKLKEHSYFTYAYDANRIPYIYDVWETRSQAYDLYDTKPVRFLRIGQFSPKQMDTIIQTIIKSVYQIPRAGKFRWNTEWAWGGPIMKSMFDCRSAYIHALAAMNENMKYKKTNSWRH